MSPCECLDTLSVSVHLLSLNISLMQVPRIGANRHTFSVFQICSALPPLFYPGSSYLVPVVSVSFHSPPNHSCKTVFISHWKSNYTLSSAPAIGDGNLNAVAPPACRTCYLVASSTNASFVGCCFTNWDTLCLHCISYILSGHGCVPLHVDVWTPSGQVFLLLQVVMLLRDHRSVVVMLELHCCL